MKIWAVSCGEYSDYRVGPYFTTQELAQRYCDIKNKDASSYDRLDIEGPIEVYSEVLDPQSYLYITHRFGEAYVSIDQLQERIDYYIPGIDTINKEPCKTTIHIILGARSKVPNKYIEKDSIMLTVEGFDTKRVRKVFSEKKAQIIADFDILIAAEKQRLKGKKSL